MTDNAKGLLALANELDDIETDAAGKCNWSEVATVSSALRRLSARQQASVEDVARSIAFQEWPLARTDERAKWVAMHWHRYEPEARALLAKYDIFEKVEG